LLFVAVCCCLLLFVAVCCCLLLFVAVCCCLSCLSHAHCQLPSQLLEWMAHNGVKPNSHAHLQTPLDHSASESVYGVTSEAAVSMPAASSGAFGAASGYRYPNPVSSLGQQPSYRFGPATGIVSPSGISTV
jgi:hypothetical protein